MPSSHRLSRWAIALLALAAGCSDGALSSRPKNHVPTGDLFGPLGDRSDLPVDQRVVVKHLAGPVDVVRDLYGRPHIYATNVADAMRVEGYWVAQDRALQLEIVRRLAEGRLAEILGDIEDTLIDQDIVYRHIGLARVAKAEYEKLPPKLKDVVDAYADGVSQYFAKLRSGEVQLALDVPLIDGSAFTPWTGVDSLAIARLQTHLLSYDADVDIANQMFFDAARATFTASSTDPLAVKRAGFERDFVRFAPAVPATTTTGYPTSTSTGSAKKPPKHAQLDLRKLSSGYVNAMRRIRSKWNPDGFGSNDWAISSKRSASGHALVASDPHLVLDAPATFWPVSIDVTAPPGHDKSDDLAVGGVAFPGIPGIILGNNRHIAWGATVAGYDVSDAYAETLTPDGKGVMFQGKPVQLQTIDEVIKIKGQKPYTYHVQVVPHHGPIQPTILPDHTVAPLDPSLGAISIKWTGLEPTTEFAAVFNLLRAPNVDEARLALDAFQVGAQNWMIGDTSGSILWTSHAQVPMRDARAFTNWNANTYAGDLPCFVLPGGGTAEWTGFLPDDLVPWEKKPAAGYIATANNDPIGDTLDNDPSNDTLPDGTPMYTHCSFDIGFREGRIQDLINAHTTGFSMSDLVGIQADSHSAMGERLVPRLLQAIADAEAERTSPGIAPALAAIVADPAYDSTKVLAVRDLLTAWGAYTFPAASGIDLVTNKPEKNAGKTAADSQNSAATLVFNAWLVRLVARVFDDELDALQITGIDRETKAKALLHLFEADPQTLATYDAATGDSAIWDDLGTPEVESREEREIRALLDALTDLAGTDGNDLTAYRWGAHHTVTFTAIVPLFASLSIPPAGDKTFPKGFPRKGDLFSIDASDYDFVRLTDPFDFTYGEGPNQRFVAELDPSGPVVWNAIPGGNVWNAKSKHFRDEAEYWRANGVHAVPFALGDVIVAKESRSVAWSP